MNHKILIEHITRSVLKRLTINEADSREEYVKKLIRNVFAKHLNVDEVVPSSTYYVNNNPKTKWGEYLYFNLRHSFGLMQNSDLGLLKFIAPIAYSDEVLFDIDDSKQTEQNKLKEITRILKDKSNGVFDNIKGKQLSFTELCSIVEPIIKHNKEQEEEELSNGNFTGGGKYKIIENTWSFKEGFGKVQLDGKYNYINTEGNILSDKWFDFIYNFNDGFAVVMLNRKYNYINTDGKLISEQWFDDAWDFEEGIAKVNLNGKLYKIDKNGNLTQWE